MKAAPEFSAVFEGVAFGQLSLATLAAGDVAAAVEASDAARQRLLGAPQLFSNFFLPAEVELARGDLIEARR